MRLLAVLFPLLVGGLCAAVPRPDDPLPITGQICSFKGRVIKTCTRNGVGPYRSVLQFELPEAIHDSQGNELHSQQYPLPGHPYDMSDGKPRSINPESAHRDHWMSVVYYPTSTDDGGMSMSFSYGNWCFWDEPPKAGLGDRIVPAMIRGAKRIVIVANGPTALSRRAMRRRDQKPLRII